MEAFSEQGVVTYEDPEKHSAFLCNRCAIFDVVLGSFVAFALSAGQLFGQYSLLRIPAIGWLFWVSLLFAAACFGVFLFQLLAMLLDRVPPALVDAGFAQRRMLRILRRQNPDIAYITQSEYEKRTGGITP
ncbi:MAG: hypothetical protein FWF60_05190 [Oscillospiraceae bacterium]|nr:hypothetical protein [Oscillospiraceae bacterium]